MISRWLKRFVLSLTLITSLSALGLTGFLYQAWHKPITVPEQLVKIEAGASYYRVLRQLEQKKIIQDRWALKALGWIYPELKQVKAGTFQLSGLYTQSDILTNLVEGRPHQFKITFIEGSNWREWQQQLSSHPNIIHQIDDKPELVTQLTDGMYPEGLFFPDTYYFSDGASDVSILRQARAKMQQVLKEVEMQTAGIEQSLDWYGLQTLASIIEKETSQDQERTTIASVFYNRLKKNMRLQTDPTVIYGLGERYDGDIKRSHLREFTPYNTYVIKGLPPTPIAMPGKASLLAARAPLQTDFYYFVANGLGGHAFSKTLAEHNKAVRAYLELTQ